MNKYEKYSDKELKELLEVEEEKVKKRKGSLTIKCLELATELLKRTK
jgi:hypothetical protein